MRSFLQDLVREAVREGDRLLRTETCLNDPYHLDVGRKLGNLPELKNRLSITTDRYLTQQSELLDSTVDTGALAELASPIVVGRRRVPGVKLHDDRVIRLLDTLLYNGGLLADWTSRDAHARLLERHRLKESDYTISQFRYDLRKLRAHGLAERIGRTRRYRLTDKGVRLGVLLVKARDRFLGPIVASSPMRSARGRNPSTVEAALRRIDAAVDDLCEELRLRRAA